MKQPTESGDYVSGGLLTKPNQFPWVVGIEAGCAKSKYEKFKNENISFILTKTGI